MYFFYLADTILDSMQWCSQGGGGGRSGRSTPGGTFRGAATLRLFLKSLRMEKVF